MAEPDDAIADGLDSTEHRRWLIALGLPFIAAGAFLAATFGTGNAWFFAPVLSLVPIWISALAYLALTSDARDVAQTANVQALPPLKRPTGSLERKAA